MLSTKLAWAVNRSVATLAASSPASHRTTQILAVRQQSHQRRPSSSNSKASSCPPNSTPSGDKPAPAAKATAEKTPVPPATSQPRGTKQRAGKKQRARSVVGVNAADRQEDQFAGLPAVPGTQHLSYSDISISSFFSLHRPLSLSTTIPPPSSNTVFDSVFETRQQRDPWQNGNSAERRPEDVVYALRNMFDNLDFANEGPEDNLRWEVVQAEETPNGVRHLDGGPMVRSLDELVAQFKPFKVPPPPQPFPEELKTAEKKKASKPRQKRYATTIVLTESTGVNGQTTYTASSSPIVCIPEEPPAFGEPSSEEGYGRLPLRERRLKNERAFFLRQQYKIANRPAARPFVRTAPSAARLDKMLLISVKRQRKLKMKKHKYKKLMRRTRNLRRRQDRA